MKTGAAKLSLFLPAGTTSCMGHVRMTTQGEAKYNANNHPFPGYAQQEFALAHNGVLHNDRELHQQHHLPKTKIGTDSYVAVQLLEASGMIDFKRLAEMAEQLEGTFTFSVLTQQEADMIRMILNCFWMTPSCSVWP